MGTSQLPIIAPLALLVVALVIPLAGLWRRALAYPLALAGAGLALAGAILGLLAVLRGETLRYHFGGWAPPLGIEYVLDPLSAFLLTVVTSLGFLVLVSARRSIEDELPERAVVAYALALLLLAGLCGMVLTGDLFNLYVFLEIAALAAYALIALGGRRAPLAAFRYLILGSIGGGFYLLGVGFLYFSTGTLNMADLAALLPELYGSRAVLAGAALIVVGLALKMALFPLHMWLPDAYTHAPSAVSSLIAPIMTKVSVYALIRVHLDVFQPAFFRDELPVLTLIAWLSAAGIVAASFLAIVQTDLRRMLAYSSVGQIGYLGLGIGLGTPLALAAALLHILNHACMKGCLFLICGGVKLRTGSVELARLRGIGRRLPWTMACFTLAALAMIGIPPTAGFFSKWYLVLACVGEGRWVFVGVIAASSLLSAVYFFRILETVYAEPTADDDAVAAAAVVEGAGAGESCELPPSMLGPIAVLAVGVLALGFLNATIVTWLLESVAAPLGAA